MSLLPINISSYDGFRTDALLRASQGLGYDVDGWYGYQCWDLAAELWMNIPEFQNSGYWPHTGPNSAAEECWTVSKTANAGNSFDLIYNLSDVKRGDVIVIGSSPISSVGHIAFADEDYSGGTSMNLLGQNQVNPSAVYGHIPTVTSVGVSAYFLGAFRYKEWATPVRVKTTEERKHFPWPVAWRHWRSFERNGGRNGNISKR